MSRWDLNDDVHLTHVDSEQELSRGGKYSNLSQVLIALGAVVIALIVTMYLFTLATASGLISTFTKDQKQEASFVSEAAPDYFHTTPQIYAGPTATAQVAPFLAQINPAPFGNEASFVPNTPLETAVPIAGNINDTSIFRLTGHLSPYFPGPGFGSDEYPLPPGTNISQVHVLHRHGSRYPTGGSTVSKYGEKIYNLTHNGTAIWAGQLSFLNDWKYRLGAEILVAKGRQELFDSGVLHYYNYGALYNTSTKIVARTTTQDRMLKSAEYFMAGFFGLEWTKNATIEAQIEQMGYNTSLAGYWQCPNSHELRFNSGSNASVVWKQKYLADATRRLQAFVAGYTWTVTDSYNAQMLCPYETVAFGYSPWCELFTYEEWQGFEYSIDLQFNGDAGFASPTARGMGIGYVQEVFARLQGHLYDLPPGATTVNYTLDTVASTFPLNQSLYFDFSHDTNIMSILTAFGLKQFAEDLPKTSMRESRSLVVSHVTPFAARVVFEIIRAPHPVKSTRPTSRHAAAKEYYDQGPQTSYVHVTINQRTLPLFKSYSSCEQRDDGWCDLETFMSQLNTTLAAARYEYSCFGNYSAVPYGNITDGVPISKRAFDLSIALGGTGSVL